LLPLILYASRGGKIIKRAGKWFLAGGACSAGEQLVDGIWDGVKGLIPTRDSGGSSGSSGGTGGTTAGTTWGTTGGTTGGGT